MNQNMKRGLALTLSLTMSGCMVGINYKRPDTKAPPLYGEAHDGPTTHPATAVDLTQWWKTFNDPELESLIHRAIDANYSLLTAEARVRQSRAQLGATEATLFPVLTVNGTATKSQTPGGTVVVPQGSPGAGQTTFGAPARP